MNDPDDELDYSDYEQPSGQDDGCGPYDSNEGCSHCGFWQCDGTSCRW